MPGPGGSHPIDLHLSTLPVATSSLIGIPPSATTTSRSARFSSLSHTTVRSRVPPRTQPDSEIRPAEGDTPQDRAGTPQILNSAPETPSGSYQNHTATHFHVSFHPALPRLGSNALRISSTPSSPSAAVVLLTSAETPSRLAVDSPSQAALPHGFSLTPAPVPLESDRPRPVAAPPPTQANLPHAMREGVREATPLRCIPQTGAQASIAGRATQRFTGTSTASVTYGGMPQSHHIIVPVPTSPRSRSKCPSEGRFLSEDDISISPPPAFHRHRHGLCYLQRYTAESPQHCPESLSSTFSWLVSAERPHSIGRWHIHQRGPSVRIVPRSWK